MKKALMLFAEGFETVEALMVAPGRCRSVYGIH